MTRIDVPDAPRNLVFGFNDRGQIVGNYENTAASSPPTPEILPTTMGSPTPSTSNTPHNR